MRFCANPRCRLHQYRVKDANQPLVVNSAPTSSVEACACKQIFHHHAYRNAAAPPVYFCDVCHQAIEMVRRQRLRAVSGTG